MGAPHAGSGGTQTGFDAGWANNLPDGGFGNPSGSIDAAVVDASQPAPTLSLSPAGSTLTISLDGSQTVAFGAAISTTGAAASGVQWSLDSKDLGSIDASSGVFTPNGTAGVVHVTASAGSLSSTTSLTIVVSAQQEGDPDAGNMPAGAGGLGGVGGDGGGTKISDAKLRAALDATPAQDAALQWLYPYDGTVWPRGLPAPLLQWQVGSHAPLAVKIHIDVDAAFHYDGYFGPPSGLAAGAPIARLPIPQDAWRAATQSGTKMKVSMQVAASDGAGGYSAFSSGKTLSFTVAPTTLRGTVYYNSYGTKLAENYNGAMGGDGRFGGATLAITGNAYDPTLVAGKTTTDSSGCRVCHVVSADGSRLIAQQSNNPVSSSYSLMDMNKETTYTSADNGKFAWAALTPDGTLALGNAGPPGDNPANTASLTTSALYRVSDGAVLTAQGLSDFVTQAAMPAFSPDGKKVAFNFNAGPGNAYTMGDGKSLVVMDFSKVDDTTYAFKNPTRVYQASDPSQRPGWPFFLPDGSGLVFELEVQAGNYGNKPEHFMTRAGARGQLWWTDLAGNAHALDRANGTGYLPTGPNNHTDDTTMNYEPTVAPIVAGGYAWVVFTSRRMYGNVATRDPYQSDPREADLTSGNPDGPTTKKLWVTAIDLPAKPGTDPSHPAFYLPAQELFAGNSRGFWVLDACKQNNSQCGGGDECCGGYCRLVGEFDYPVCSDAPPPGSCAMEYEACNVDGDCCAVNNQPQSCISGRCAQLQVF